MTYYLIAGLIFLLLSGTAGYYLNQFRTKKQARLLQNELQEKIICLQIADEEHDWLIKEIHHRVKNNLQIVISLLNTQANYETDKYAKQAIRNSQHRMYAISLVHQRLYQSGNVSEVDMLIYSHELIEYLKDVFDVSERITIEMDMKPLLLDISMAVAFGLIVNEAVSNAFKYAFPAKAPGKVKVSLESEDLLNYKLSISDNGIGFQENDHYDPADSFGNTLIAGLTRQLGGTMETINKNGVAIIIIFRKPEPIFKIQDPH